MRSIVPRSAGPWLAVVTLTAAGLAAAVGYGLTAPKRYRATAQLLVAPVAVNDPTFTGLDVLRDTGGRRTAAADAVALLRSPQVADDVRARLGLARSRDSLLAALHAHVADSSDVVAVTVEDTAPAGPAQLANAFADALVTQRIAALEAERERLSAREAGLAARERDIEAKLAELREAAESAVLAPSPDPGHEERVRVLTNREIALARRVAETTAREAALEARAAELTRRAEELDEARPAEPEPEGQTQPASE